MTTVKELKKWIELFPDEYVVESIYGDDTLFIIDTEAMPTRNIKGRFRIDEMTLEWRYDEDLIHKINDALFAAVNHGGDPGGAYFCFPKELKKAVDSLAEILGVTWEWNKPQREDYPVLKDYDGNSFEVPEQYRGRS